MIASTNLVRKFLLAAPLGTALVGFGSMAFALPVHRALALVKAAPSAVEDVHWRGRRVGWRRGTRWVGWRRAYPIYIGPTYLLRYDSCNSGGSWPNRLGCW
jgi:hypothetical protein